LVEARQWNEMIRVDFGEFMTSASQDFKISELSQEDIGEELCAELTIEQAAAPPDDNEDEEMFQLFELMSSVKAAE
jgi:predicted house-cleaning noncanonical NTP pyrophosphatase (MazG superfamily)